MAKRKGAPKMPKTRVSQGLGSKTTYERKTRSDKGFRKGSNWKRDSKGRFT